MFMFTKNILLHPEPDFPTLFNLLGVTTEHKLGLYVKRNQLTLSISQVNMIVSRHNSMLE